MSYIFQQARLINPLEHLDRTGTIKVADNGIIEAVMFGNEPLETSSLDKVIDLRGQDTCSGAFRYALPFQGTRSGIQGNA